MITCRQDVLDAVKRARQEPNPTDAFLNLLLGSPILHFSTFVTIEDKDKKRVRLDGTEGNSKPNILQYRMNAAYEWFRENNLPIRIMVLKCRQDGSSTFTGAMFHHHSRTHQVDGMIMGDEGSRTEKAWKIFCDYSRNDSFAWDSVVRRSNTEKFIVEYKDKSRGLWEHDTANDPKAGIGGTRHCLWMTEAARYSKTGARADVNAITAVISSVAPVAKSMIVAESTAEGVGSWFHQNWQGASWLEDIKKGDFGNGWIKMFAAWHEFSECRLKREARTEQYYEETLSPREKRGQTLYGWDIDQIAWRRWAVASLSAGNEDSFDQDYPEDDVSAFISSGNPRFNAEGVARLEKMSKGSPGTVGILQRVGPGKVTFIPDPEGWLWVSEKPTAKRDYLSAVDTMKGEQSEGSKDPDAHASLVLRASYLEEAGGVHVQHNLAVAACIHVKGGCRWDIGMLGERTAMLAEWYGDCMVVPEVNGPGIAVIQKLRDCGARIYQRRKADHINPGKTLMVLGWVTDKGSRGSAIGELAELIREQKIDCAYEPLVKELRTFVTHNGKDQARPGAHDDWVLAVAIGAVCMGFASSYREQQNIVHQPYSYGGSPSRRQKAGFT